VGAVQGGISARGEKVIIVDISNKNDLPDQKYKSFPTDPREFWRMEILEFDELDRSVVYRTPSYIYVPVKNTWVGVNERYCRKCGRVLPNSMFRDNWHTRTFICADCTRAKDAEFKRLYRKRGK